MTHYLAPPGENQTEVKRSRFLVFGEPISQRQQHDDQLAQLQQTHNKANHVCWAFRLQGDRAEEGYSDDGEPSGTAGMPMLNVLRHHNIVDYAVYVVRYFGGTKLGTGGLQRAYSGAVQHLLSELTLNAIVPMKSGIIKADFADESAIRREILLQHGSVTNCQYFVGHIELGFELPAHNTDELAHYCQLHQLSLSFTV